MDHQAPTQRLQIARKMHLVQMKHKDWSYYRQPRLQCFGELTEDVSTSKISFLAIPLSTYISYEPLSFEKSHIAGVQNFKSPQDLFRFSVITFMAVLWCDDQ